MILGGVREGEVWKEVDMCRVATLVLHFRCAVGFQPFVIAWLKMQWSACR